MEEKIKRQFCIHWACRALSAWDLRLGLGVLSGLPEDSLHPERPGADSGRQGPGPNAGGSYQQLSRGEAHALGLCIQGWP